MPAEKQIKLCENAATVGFSLQELDRFFLRIDRKDNETINPNDMGLKEGYRFKFSARFSAYSYLLQKCKKIIIENEREIFF